ncbi:HPF/RaiA family ribosome-associated protein [Nocardia sp. NBC_01329]|uniref:HPF/RaiA family ribosome-associated protein n=1 Tax=Nocardia sp. NBC_01329 TaxID=2903594 RepID=UPI002E1524B7|nr:ribosomal subunit interface protein [Nocardia sp. NBC_01329]
MQIQINTDSNIDSGEKLIRQVEEEIASTLARFSEQIISVEAHLSDQNAGKGGPSDKRCVLQARPAGQQPVAVSHDAATISDACRGAAESMAHLLASRFGRLHETKGGDSIRHPHKNHPHGD